MWFKQKYCINCDKPLGKNSQYNGTKRCIPCAGKFLKLSKKMQGENASNFRHGRTLIDHYCKCGKEIDYRSKRCHTCADIYLHKIGILNSKGKNNPMFNDWSSREPYSSEWSEELKEFIRKRDNYTCQLCHKRGKTVHHIDYNKQNCKETNLIITCLSCNARANFNRDYWTIFYTNKIKEIILWKKS